MVAKLNSGAWTPQRPQINPANGNTAPQRKVIFCFTQVCLNAQDNESKLFTNWNELNILKEENENVKESISMR